MHDVLLHYDNLSADISIWLISGSFLSLLQLPGSSHPSVSSPF